MYPTRLAGAIAVACAVAGCAVGPDYRSPAPAAPPRFQATLPAAQAGLVPADAEPASAAPATAAEAATVGLGWWRQFDDPLLAVLVQAAQADAPGLAQALARLDQARALYQGAGAARLPELGVGINATRARSMSAPGSSLVTGTVNRGFDASWEIDLFGARAKAVEAAGARWQAREAEWHVTRVSLAAEVAATLVDYRACRVSADILVQDLQSREAVARLTAEALKTGYMPRAEGFLSDASAASARERLIAQRAQCDLDVKALVALTGLAEADLRNRLDAVPAAAGSLSASASMPGLPRPAALLVESVPAQVLAQRPDIAAAERELAAAAAEINVAEAQRYPSLSLRGSIGVGRLSSGGVSGSADTWSFGPASLNLPLFDGGRRRAAAAEAQGRYDEQAGLYRQRVRDAVREIEEALVRLDAAARRETDADIAAREYQRYFQAGDEKFRAGASNMLDLEEARRNSLSARLTQVGVQRDRVQAWIALYKALGGGWQSATLASTASATTASTTVNAGAAAPRL